MVFLSIRSDGKADRSQIEDLAEVLVTGYIAALLTGKGCVKVSQYEALGYTMSTGYGCYLPTAKALSLDFSHYVRRNTTYLSIDLHTT